jgi:hypothetical protein
MANAIVATNHGRYHSSGWRVRLAVVIALTAPLAGCSQMTGTSGDEGTIDLVKSQEAAASNPEYAKKGAKLGGEIGTPPEKRASKRTAK